MVPMRPPAPHTPTRMGVSGSWSVRVSGHACERTRLPRCRAERGPSVTASEGRCVHPLDDASRVVDGDGLPARSICSSIGRTSRRARGELATEARHASARVLEAHLVRAGEVPLRDVELVGGDAVGDEPLDLDTDQPPDLAACSGRVPA
jgi:hypothetical protein